MLNRAVVVLIAILALARSAAAAAPCSALLSTHLPDATITAADSVPAGAFVPPGGAAIAPATAAVYSRLPEFCRVSATLRPTADSDIRIEVWLPAASWNGKFQAVGGGGWAGVISYPALAAAVAQGYASASTDTGHVGNSAAFALGHPEKVVDMGYRAVHEMTVRAKEIIDRYYGSPIKLSLWNGCSQGGRQGITEAQRYPADYDAIIAGASAVDWMHLHAGRIALNHAVNRTAATAVPASKYPAIHAAVLKACDALDGVADGVLENPPACRFDPAVLACKGVEDSSCLTPDQVEGARAFYLSVRDAKTGAVIMPGLEPGAELRWSVLGGVDAIGNAVEAFKYIVFKDPKWDARRFSLATDLALADQLDGGVLASTETNLAPFFDRGGKLLMYHGWSDPQVPPENSVAYFRKVVERTGAQRAGTSIQLYMVPGMDHCAGGPGTDAFDKVAAMEQWIAAGKAPASIVAAHRLNGVVDKTRPLCPYGQVAKWDGRGDVNQASSFSCR